MMLEIKNVSKSFGGLKVLENLSLTVEEGLVSSLIGPNGAGKTTLFNVITGVIPADSGEVLFLGENITRMPVHKICRLGMARTYQRRNLFPNLTVYENVIAGTFKDTTSLKTREGQVEEILDLLELTDKADAIVSRLPPLDMKLVELGRSLATSPKLILLDELIGGLLSSETEKICDIVETLQREGYTIFQIGHEMRPIMRTSDHICVLDRGRLIARGSPDEIRSNEVVLDVYLEAGGDE
ncbi:MAG: ABC transporter ATP-binding protein [Firmicutes bacterium]|nr:ABC transporter ATP-binding protein [Bacillota bacterium]